MNGRVLIVAGSDSGGGAGIQADIKTVTALGGYAMTALTALTAQNTQGVSAIHEAPPDFVAKQMRVVITDLGVDAIKIGMLHRPQVIEAVCQVIAELAADVPLVVDPVMVAKGGARLLEDAAVATLRQRLIPGATLITPNLPEAAALVGADLADGEMLTALRGLGARAVLLKGGHAAGPEVIDHLISDAGVIETFSSPRLATRHTHGTGCTLSSAIATGLAQGLSLSAAVARGRRYVIEAIRTAPGYGHGHGPLNHGHTVAEFLP